MDRLAHGRAGNERGEDAAPGHGPCPHPTEPLVLLLPSRTRAQLWAHPRQSQGVRPPSGTGSEPVTGPGTHELDTSLLPPSQTGYGLQGNGSAHACVQVQRKQLEPRRHPQRSCLALLPSVLRPAEETRAVLLSAHPPGLRGVGDSLTGLLPPLPPTSWLSLNSAFSFLFFLFKK